MRNLKIHLFYLLCLGVVTLSYAHRPGVHGAVAITSTSNNETTANFRADCAQSTSQIDMAINNVRARLLGGGDVWWDLEDGQYIVPKVEPGSGQPEVSSIFAGSVWLGGFDPGGNLKMAAQTYRSGTENDFWPGPLVPDRGTIQPDTCSRWDRHFTVNGESIRRHLDLAIQLGDSYTAELIPEDVKGWPARGNQFFFDVHNFELPNTVQGLAAFFDADSDGNYEPLEGDYPRIEIRGCDAPQFPDEMIFWIYNDEGGGAVHTQTLGAAIRMEVQVQAFAYETNDEVNDMTFQRYKLINRASESIDSTYFGIWVDPDLGCFEDDFIGCDTSRSLAYVYNEDDADGTTGCDCPTATGRVNTYCRNIPILGVDYFRGPLGPKLFCNGVDASGGLCNLPRTLEGVPPIEPDTIVELPMSSFTYYNNAAVCDPINATTDPDNAAQYYNYLTGSWLDGTRFTFGNGGYNPGTGADIINFAFPQGPNDETGWSMCTAGLGCGDRRTIQASGPFRLDPGAVNELIVGVVWVPDIQYPCPDITPLLSADDVAQALFDNCFDILDGPDAPDACVIELDEEIILTLSNEASSNNFKEEYKEADIFSIGIPGIQDSFYLFEGYQIYQLRNENVSGSELDDPDKSILIAQVDINNEASALYNWAGLANPIIGAPANIIYTPDLRVEGANTGIKHTFRITEDQFASGDSRRLINHRKYYFRVVAYAFNEYEPFIQDGGSIRGQRNPYLRGRRNARNYTVIPRPINDLTLNAIYGDGVQVTRFDGEGAGGNFLDMTTETRESIINETFDGRIVYEEGQGPIDVELFNPLNIREGKYRLTFVDSDITDDTLEVEATWNLEVLDDNDNVLETIASEATIAKLNEQLIADYGFSVTVGQTQDAGEDRFGTNGAIGAELEYADPNGSEWFLGIPDRDGTQFDYQKTSTGQPLNAEDPNQVFSTFGSGSFSPYVLADFNRIQPDGSNYITPAWTNDADNNEQVLERNELSQLNNVDIVFTSDKDKWSRCIVVESASWFYTSPSSIGVPTEGGRLHFDLRDAPSVSKEADADGQPIPDSGNETGFGWFPGYAVDVETGKRLNIFFGENSSYNGQFAPDEYETGEFIGADMMWNPTDQIFLNAIPPQGQGTQQFTYNFMSGGQHFIYVTDAEYDECSFLSSRLGHPNPIRKTLGLAQVKWASLPVIAQGEQLLSYGEGLIPNDLVVKLRVDNPYSVESGTDDYNGYPTYEFEISGKAPVANNTEAGVNQQLDAINIVPNPYYGFSGYETTALTNIVKMTNLPAKATITIYSLDGRFIRQYNRNETPALKSGANAPLPSSQIVPDLEWDLKNNKGIPISSGVYLIHVDAPGLGERVIKWFGVNRQFDPSGL